MIMKCPECGFEQKNVLYDETMGAVFVSRDSGRGFPMAWPAVLGLKKYAGCVEFGLGGYDSPEGDDANTALVLSDSECNKVFFDSPAAGEAWLVTPCDKNSYWWERVDECITLSEE
jgi:hypothetical protein